MRTKAVSLAVGAACVIATWAAQADTITAGPFSVDVSRTLTVRYDGQILFSGDRCAAYRGLKPDAPALVRTLEKGVLSRNKNCVTFLARDGRNTFRREVMVTPEALHVTYEIQVFGATGGTHLQYELLSPAATLDGSAYKATTGLLRRARKTVAGAMNSKKSTPFQHLLRTCVYLTLKSPALACTMDFNPMGSWQGTSNYGESWSTSLYHDGERYRFSMLCSSARNGATFTGKIIVRPGAKPYEALHRNDALAYTTSFPTTLALNFSENDASDKYQLCPPATPNGKPFRWREPKNVRIVQRAAGGLLRRDFATATDGANDGVLELEQPSGLYLMTLNMHDPKEDTGPFDVIGPDGPLLRGLRVPQGRFLDKTIAVRFRKGKAALRFSGKWKINALALQLILQEHEDFILERPYWNMGADLHAPPRPNHRP